MYATPEQIFFCAGFPILIVGALIVPLLRRILQELIIANKRK